MYKLSAGKLWIFFGLLMAAALGVVFMKLLLFSDAATASKARSNELYATKTIVSSGVSQPVEFEFRIPDTHCNDPLRLVSKSCFCFEIIWNKKSVDNNTLIDPAQDRTLLLVMQKGNAIDSFSASAVFNGLHVNEDYSIVVDESKIERSNQFIIKAKLDVKNPIIVNNPVVPLKSTDVGAGEVTFTVNVTHNCPNDSDRASLCVPMVISESEIVCDSRNIQTIRKIASDQDFPIHQVDWELNCRADSSVKLPHKFGIRFPCCNHTAGHAMLRVDNRKVKQRKLVIPPNYNFGVVRSTGSIVRRIPVQIGTDLPNIESADCEKPFEIVGLERVGESTEIDFVNVVFAPKKGGDFQSVLRIEFADGLLAESELIGVLND